MWELPTDSGTANNRSAGRKPSLPQAGARATLLVGIGSRKIHDRSFYALVGRDPGDVVSTGGKHNTLGLFQYCFSLSTISAEEQGAPQSTQFLNQPRLQSAKRLYSGGKCGSSTAHKDADHLLGRRLPPSVSSFSAAPSFFLTKLKPYRTACGNCRQDSWCCWEPSSASGHRLQAAWSAPQALCGPTDRLLGLPEQPSAVGAMIKLAYSSALLLLLLIYLD